MNGKQNKYEVSGSLRGRILPLSEEISEKAKQQKRCLLLCIALIMFLKITIIIKRRNFIENTLKPGPFVEVQ